MRSRPLPAKHYSQFLLMVAEEVVAEEDPVEEAEVVLAEAEVVAEVCRPSLR